MTKEERRARRAARKARDERMEKIREAMQDERARFNEKVLGGAVAILDTAFGLFEVDGVTPEFWFLTHPKGEKLSTWNRRSFAGCNNGSWADLLEQVDEPRHPSCGLEVS